MSEMVERVARALYEATPFKQTAGGFEEQSDVYQRMCMVLARAAVAAMREPTQSMMVAGGLKAETLMFEDASTGVIFKDMGEVFTVMLDAALAEGNPS